ncbi:nuclear transport factor 2 family protein [Streptomyces sp. CA-106131]|uniref:nuclear transport factor 2 family protein n=1 Tax=Streptomyces sp. CA-106131 TaxID=3240045 RepID=UPI003D8D1956
MTTQMDHAEISMLVDRFFRVLDERKSAADWTRDFLTDDARMETPLGTSQGAEAIRAAEEALERYDRTQHIASGIITDADAGAERATASWNALMTHVHHDATLQERGGDADPLFTVGGRFEADLRRTPDGWRFSRVVVRPIWTKGQPPSGVGAQS